MKRVCAILLLLAMVFCTASAETASSSLQEMYAEAELLMVQGDYVSAAAKFEALSAYSDAAQMTLYCKAVYAAEMGMYVMSVDALSSLGQFKDAPQLAQYYTACSFLDSAKTRTMDNLVNPELYSEIFTEQLLNKMKDPYYETSNLRLIYCYRAQAIFSELALYKDSLMKVAECKTTSEEILKAEAAAKETAYQEALALENAGNYESAIEAYKKLNDYMDSAERIAACEAAIAEAAYQEALALENAGYYELAIKAYKALEDYKDSAERIAACEAAIAEAAKEAAKEAVYQDALAFESTGDCNKTIEAYRLFISLGEYKDSAHRANEIWPSLPATSAQYTLCSAEGKEWLTYSIDFEYDGDGNLIFKKENHPYPREINYVYENGKLVSGTESGVGSMENGKTTSTYTSQQSYNEQGDLIKAHIQYFSLSLQKVTIDRTDVYSYTYEYENERISKKTRYHSDGSVNSHTVYEYDEYGRLLYETTTPLSGEQYSVIEYHYE